MTYPNARDCEHGSLRRQCLICELMEELKEVKAERDALQARIDKAEKVLTTKKFASCGDDELCNRAKTVKLFLKILRG